MAIKTHCFTCRKRTGTQVGFSGKKECLTCKSSKDIYYKTNYTDLLILFVFVLVVIASVFGLCWVVYESIKLL